MTPRTAITVLSLVAAGCASARTDFKPYSTTSPRPPVVADAVVATESDLKTLAAAGAVIVGTIRARGNGFAGADDLNEAAAVEAARHGGTHVVVGMSLHEDARGRRLESSGGAKLPGTSSATFAPGRTIELSALVLRLPDDANWYALPARLRPQRETPVAQAPAARPTPPPSAPPAAPAKNATAALDAPPSAPGATAELPAPLPSQPSSGAAAEPVLIDGSHIAPLSPAGE